MWCMLSPKSKTARQVLLLLLSRGDGGTKEQQLVLYVKGEMPQSFDF